MTKLIGLALSVMAVGCVAGESSAPEDPFENPLDGLGEGGGKADESCPIASGALESLTPPTFRRSDGMPWTNRHAPISFVMQGSPRVVTSFVGKGIYTQADNDRAPIKVTGTNDLVFATVDLAVAGEANPCYAFTTQKAGALEWSGTAYLYCKSFGTTTARSLTPITGSTIDIASRGSAKHIVFNNNFRLQYMKYSDGGQAQIEEVARDYPVSAKIAIDSTGRPHVVWRGTDRSLFHAVRDADGTWTKTEIAPADQGPAYQDGMLLNDHSFVLVQDRAVVAYHQLSTRSLRLWRQGADSESGQISTLVAPAEGRTMDFAGDAVTLERDCAGRIWVLYSRRFGSDGMPAADHLWLSRLDRTTLTSETMVPGSTTVVGGHELDLAINQFGDQFISAIGDGNTVFAMRR